MTFERFELKQEQCHCLCAKRNSQSTVTSPQTNVQIYSFKTDARTMTLFPKILRKRSTDPLGNPPRKNLRSSRAELY